MDRSERHVHGCGCSRTRVPFARQKRSRHERVSPDRNRTGWRRHCLETTQWRTHDRPKLANVYQFRQPVFREEVDADVPAKTSARGRERRITSEEKSAERTT